MMPLRQDNNDRASKGECDFAPLIAEKEFVAGSRKTAISSAPLSSPLLKRFVFSVVLVCSLVMSMLLIVVRRSNVALSEVIAKEPIDHNRSDTGSAQPPEHHLQPETTNAEKLKMADEKFQSAKQSLVEKLKADYGEENFQTLFMHEDGVSTRGRTFIGSISDENIGWDRLKRKVTIKILKSLEKAQQTERRRKLGGENEDADRLRMIPFIWATGGHSAAAGHGNFYNQSYTAFMEKGVKDVFAAVGMNFVGRNYAMGGHSSGPELGFCIESIFGADFDVLSWDFGMTDGRENQYAEMYFYRAGWSVNNPAAIMLNAGNRKSIVAPLEERGMTVLYQDDRKDIENLVPDSAGLSEEEIASMPPFVRNFRCGRLIENGDPHCGSQKFDNSICPLRLFESSWHPGWKDHALQGNLMALFLVEIVGDALNDTMSTPSDLKEMLTQLESQVKADHQRFLESELPPLHKEWNVPESEAEEIHRIFYKQPNFCHTSQLPAEIRHKGILTESAPVGLFDLPDGLLSTQVDGRPNDGEHLRLVADARTRQKCSVHLNMDHIDWFHISHSEGWKDLTVPNDAEIREYGTGEPLRGVIAICFVKCPWNKCPTNNIIGGIVEKTVEMEVNGQAVESLLQISKKGCLVVSNSNGSFWKPDNSGRFTFRLRVLAPEHYMRVSSFIVW